MIRENMLTEWMPSDTSSQYAYERYSISRVAFVSLAAARVA